MVWMRSNFEHFWELVQNGNVSRTASVHRNPILPSGCPINPFAVLVGCYRVGSILLYRSINYQIGGVIFRVQGNLTTSQNLSLKSYLSGNGVQGWKSFGPREESFNRKGEWRMIGQRGNNRTRLSPYPWRWYLCSLI